MLAEFSPLEKINFSRVKEDNFWNTGDAGEEKMHKIHAYPAKFPAFITTKAISLAKKKGLDVKKIADIFCGCGTVAFESKKQGIDFWGCDINPVAILIAQVKSGDFKMELLEKYYSSIQKHLKKKRHGDYKNTNPRITYWFSEKNYNDIYALKQAIESVDYENESYKDFFLCALSNILKPTSRWLGRSIKPQVDPNKIDKDVFECFRIQIKFMFNAVVESKKTPVGKGGKKKIIYGSFLDKKTKPREPVDMIVTSPPYVTSYEYADLHQLSSLWLDYTDDYKQLRKGSIGSAHDVQEKHSDYDLNDIAKDIVKKLESGNGRPKAKSVARYFRDMQDVAKKSFDILKKDGIALFVIGNTEYKGVKIDNAKHLAYSMKDAGFSKFIVTKRNIKNKILTPYRDANGKFTTDTKSRKVYAEEFIIIGEK